MTNNTNPVSLFTFHAHQVRVVELDRNPWFVAADVCRVLGLLNPTTTLRHLGDEEKGLNPIYTLGGPQRLWFQHRGEFGTAGWQPLPKGMRWPCRWPMQSLLVETTTKNLPPAPTLC